MANVIHIGVENPDELLNTGAYGAGALIRVQSSATSGGVYADITGTGSTPTIALVTATFAYTGYDPAGTSTMWYRTRYENVGGTRLSDWSTVFQAGVGAGYCSLYDVKQDLDRTGPTVTQADELLLDYIAEMTDYIKGYLGYDLFTSDTVMYFDGYSSIANRRRLLVPAGVQTIVTLKVAFLTGASLTTVAATDYFLRPLSQDRAPGWPATEVWISDVSSSYFPPGYNNIEITGTFGFASVPPRIEGVARRTVVRAYAARQAGGNDMTGTENGTPIVSQYLSKRDREVLDSFKPLLVG